MSKCEICLIEGWLEADKKIFSTRFKRIITTCETCYNDVNYDNKKIFWRKR